MTTEQKVQLTVTFVGDKEVSTFKDLVDALVAEGKKIGFNGWLRPEHIGLITDLKKQLPL